MQILVEMCGVLGAQRLIPISSAHIDGCLFHGESGVEFARALVAGGGRVAVPTTLNVGAVDLTNPEIIRIEGDHRALATELMELYKDMGCTQTWTCAPYQAGHRPKLGDQIAWAESNAVVFANSVLGARTNRYGDFLDISAALTGFAPDYGLHQAENRIPNLRVDLSGLSTKLRASSVLYPVLGAWLGSNITDNIVLFRGVPETVTEDHLKALGAAAASFGDIGLFHIEQVTPEAKMHHWDLLELPEISLRTEDLHGSRLTLSTTSDDRLDAVALGSPHYSIDECQTLIRLLNGRIAKVPIYVCTSRNTWQALKASGDWDRLRELNVRTILDTCVVVTPIFTPNCQAIMTDSGKFANYTPSNTGRKVTYASIDECVESAILGKVSLDSRLWA